jgi:hypothetical protein
LGKRLGIVELKMSDCFLIAGSKPPGKEIIVKVIINLINKKN